MQHHDWIKQIEQWREDEPLRYQDREDAILPQYAIDRLWQIVRDRGQLDTTIVTTGVGQHQMWAAQYWKFTKPRTWFTSGGLGSMGFGLPAAMGAQAGFPDRTVIDIDGDGSFMMNIQELACAYCEKLPVKVLLLNNQHLGMVAQWEDRFFEKGDLDGALEEMLDSKVPYVLDVMVPYQEHVLPMIPSGMTVRDIIKA
jgi:acetolactate synthase-1/2/3 large subunit